MNEIARKLREGGNSAGSEYLRLRQGGDASGRGYADPLRDMHINRMTITSWR